MLKRKKNPRILYSNTTLSVFLPLYFNCKLLIEKSPKLQQTAKGVQS